MVSSQEARCPPYPLSVFSVLAQFMPLTVNQIMSCQSLLALSNLDGEATMGASNKWLKGPLSGIMKQRNQLSPDAQRKPKLPFQTRLNCSWYQVLEDELSNWGRLALCMHRLNKLIHWEPSRCSQIGMISFYHFSEQRKVNNCLELLNRKKGSPHWTEAAQCQAGLPPLMHTG